MMRLAKSPPIHSMYWKKHAKNTDKILIGEKSQKDVRQTLE